MNNNEVSNNNNTQNVAKAVKVKQYLMNNNEVKKIEDFSDVFDIMVSHNITATVKEKENGKNTLVFSSPDYKNGEKEHSHLDLLICRIDGKHDRELDEIRIIEDFQNELHKHVGIELYSNRKRYYVGASKLRFSPDYADFREIEMWSRFFGSDLSMKSYVNVIIIKAKDKYGTERVGIYDRKAKRLHY